MEMQHGTDISGQTAQFNPGLIDFATYLNDSSTGLEYANQRWYSAGYRFLTKDPSGRSASLTNPQSWNRYWYAAGDPVNLNDPSGKDPSCGPGMSWDGEGCTIATGPGAYPDACSVGGEGFDPDPTTDPGCGWSPPGASFTSTPVEPTCFAQLKYRPVDVWEAKAVDAVHSFWWVQDDVNGITLQNIITAGPIAYKDSKTQYLQAFVVPGNTDGLDNSAQSLAWGISGGTAVFAEVSSMILAAASFPVRSIYYYPLVLNSNSAAHYFSEAGGLDVSPWPAWPYIAIGGSTHILPFYAIGGSGSRGSRVGTQSVPGIVH